MANEFVQRDFRDSPFLKSDDRVLVLKPMEGKTPVSSTGLIDNRLFKGGNNLHAVMDPETCFWSMKYESGLVPEELRNQRWTSFTALKKAAEVYFNKRNVEIVEVKD